MRNVSIRKALFAFGLGAAVLIPSGAIFADQTSCKDGFFQVSPSATKVCVPYTWAVTAYDIDSTQEEAQVAVKAKPSTKSNAAGFQVWIMPTTEPTLEAAVTKYYTQKNKAVPAAITYESDTKYFGGDDVATVTTKTKKNTTATTKKKNTTSAKTTNETFFLDTDSGMLYVTTSKGKKGTTNYDAAVYSSQSVVVKSKNTTK